MVRDRIPELIRESGDRPVTHAATGAEYDRRLAEKLQEEATEFCEDGDLEELADVLAVVEAICERAGVSREELATVQREKRAERGGFSEGIVLERVEVDGATDG
nr:nucleoside triphosphate pyrophosphohydrolase [Natrononativus amylolyticus]